MKQKSIWQKPWFCIPMIILGILFLSFMLRVTVIIIEPFYTEKEYKNCLKMCESDKHLKLINELMGSGSRIDYQQCIDSCNRNYESDKKNTIKKSLQQEIEKGNQWKALQWIIFGSGSSVWF